jgi:hypothetical protein
MTNLSSEYIAYKFVQCLYKIDSLDPTTVSSRKDYWNHLLSQLQKKDIKAYDEWRAIAIQNGYIDGNKLLR